MSRKGKLIFWATFAALYPGWVVICWALWQRAAGLFSAAPEGNWGAVAVWALFGAYAGAGAGCRILGVSGEHTQLEMLGRDGPARGIPGGGALVVRQVGKLQWRRYGSSLPGVAVAAAWLVGSSSFVPNAVRAAYLVAATFATAAVLLWRWRACGSRAIATLADDGVAARRGKVSWDEIAWVEVSTHHSVFGLPSQMLCHFRGSGGQTLLTVDLSAVPEEERRRFIEAVRAKQGLPPGEATELEAAMPPAGRGTEPEAAVGPEPPRQAEVPRRRR